MNPPSLTAAPAGAGAWLAPAGDGRRFAVALGVGLLLEIAALGLLPWAAQRLDPAASLPQRVKISIVSPAPPAPPKPVQPLPPPPKPVPPPPTPPPPVPVAPPLPEPPLPAPPLPKPQVSHRARHAVPPLSHVLRAPVRPPSPVPPPVAAPPPSLASAPSANDLDRFAAALHRALQQALIFPDSAQMADESGTVRLRFEYLDGAVSNILVIRSCGFPELDEAAVRTARIAHYPPPPADFAGRVETIDVDVTFSEG